MKKEITPDKLYGCTCSLCTYVGLSLILKQYEDHKDIFIEDVSSRVYNPFTEYIGRFD